MIENREALENLEEILSVPGLGFVHVGPLDLSLSLGHPLQTVVDAIDTLRETSQRHDVPVGRNTSSESAIEEAIADGYQLIRAGGEAGAAREVISRQVPTRELKHRRGD